MQLINDSESWSHVVNELNSDQSVISTARTPFLRSKSQIWLSSWEMPGKWYPIFSNFADFDKRTITGSGGISLFSNAW